MEILSYQKNASKGQLLDNESPSKRMIYILFHWCKKFKLERVSLGLNLYKKNDNPLMYRSIKSAKSISISVVNNIFHIHLGVREMCCHLTPHYLIDAEK
jgi:hypothetical protein